jgi:hypothetical protein
VFFFELYASPGSAHKNSKINGEQKSSVFTGAIITLLILYLMQQLDFINTSLLSLIYLVASGLISPPVVETISGSMVTNLNSMKSI